MMKKSAYKANLFFVGAAKSGTTFIYNWLYDSGDFLMPIEKEANFFNTGKSNVPGVGPGDKHATFFTSNKKEYSDNFPSHYGEKYVCDFSVSYLYDEQAAASIFRYNPEAKVVVILRNPYKRAFSHYLHMRRDCREDLSFYDALREERHRREEGYEFSWHYLNMGLYSEQVRRYVELFPKESIKVMVFEDFVSCRASFLESLSSFMEVDVSPEFYNIGHKNKTGEVKNKFVARMVNRPSALRNMLKLVVPRRFGATVMEWLRQKNMKETKPEIPKEAYDMMAEHYEEDITKLESLLQRDLSFWRYEG